MPKLGGLPDISVLQDVTCALAAFNEYLIVIDLAGKKLVWCSPAFEERFSPLGSGASVDGLYLAFDGLEECAACKESAVNDEDVASVSVCYQGREYFDADLLSLPNGRQVLRLTDSAERVSAIQRYLEDREQLFSISRSVSVSEMATTLAHEINQPIGTISNLLRGIRVRLKKDGVAYEGVKQAIKQAIEQTQFASKIITRIRDYTHARQPKNQSLDLVKLLCTCMSLMDWEIKRDSIRLKMDMGSDLIFVSGDEVMLQQVFVNLIRNGIDAMNKTPRKDRALTVKIFVDDQEVEVMVVDTGSGFPEDTKDSLFMPFVSSKPTGMGVGLNICRSFIEIHQGRLWLSSNEGAGCASHVLLPIIT
jgi:signal transduction histidine kinase